MCFSAQWAASRPFPRTAPHASRGHLDGRPWCSLRPGGDRRADHRSRSWVRRAPAPRPDREDWRRAGTLGQDPVGKPVAEKRTAGGVRGGPMAARGPGVSDVPRGRPRRRGLRHGRAALVHRQPRPVRHPRLGPAARPHGRAGHRESCPTRTRRHDRRTAHRAGRRRPRTAARRAGRDRDGRHHRGRARRRSRPRPRRPPVRRHQRLAVLPRPGEENRHTRQRRVPASRGPRQILGRHRPGRRRTRRRLAHRERPGRPRPPRSPEALDWLTQLAASAPPGANGVLFAPWLNGGAPPSTTPPCAAPGSTCRWPRPGRTWPAPCSRASP